MFLHNKSTQCSSRFLGFGLIILLLLAVSACSLVKTKSRQEAIKEIEWTYQQNGLALRVNAAPELNQWDGQPHTLLMVVAQLEDPSAFEPYTKSADRLSSLLLSESAPSGVLSWQRYFIEPGSDRNYTLARVEKARYVGVALGYQHLDPSRSARIYQIGADIDYNGLLFREYHAEPQPLSIEILLGADSIQDSLSTRKTDAAVQEPRPGLWTPNSAEKIKP